MKRSIPGRLVAWATLVFASAPMVCAESGGVTLLQLPAESLPRMASAFDAALVPLTGNDGTPGVYLRIADSGTTSFLGQIRFRNGDRLVRIDRESIFAVSAARAIVGSKKPGDDIAFTVTNGGVTRVIAFEILPAALAANARPAPASENAQPSPGMNTPRPAANSGPGVIVVAAADLENEMSKTDAFTLVASAELELVQDDAGNTIGIRSSKFGDIPVSHMVGLRNGDTVLGVNGMSVTGAESIFEIADRLNGATNFVANILRGGQPVTLRVTLR